MVASDFRPEMEIRHNYWNSSFNMAMGQILRSIECIASFVIRLPEVSKLWLYLNQNTPLSAGFCFQLPYHGFTLVPRIYILEMCLLWRKHLSDDRYCSDLYIFQGNGKTLEYIEFLDSARNTYWRVHICKELHYCLWLQVKEAICRKKICL